MPLLFRRQPQSKAEAIRSPPLGAAGCKPRVQGVVNQGNGTPLTAGLQHYGGYFGLSDSLRVRPAGGERTISENPQCLYLLSIFGADLRMDTGTRALGGRSVVAVGGPPSHRSRLKCDDQVRRARRARHLQLRASGETPKARVWGMSWGFNAFCSPQAVSRVLWCDKKRR